MKLIILLYISFSKIWLDIDKRDIGLWLVKDERGPALKTETTVPVTVPVEKKVVLTKNSSF